MTDAPSARLIRRILRVDHAGEHGAVAIYQAQIIGLGPRRPELQAWLSQTLGHEMRHRMLFREAMPSRAAKPCRLLSVWRIGGWTLGRLTALMGPSAVMACTAVVERTVHGHLVDQAAFLERFDPALASLVREILVEEDNHLAFAKASHDEAKPVARLISAVVSVLTEALIALSTRGDSWRLTRDLKAAAG